MVMIVGDVWKFLVSAGVSRENCGGKGFEERNLEKVEQVRGTGNSHVVSSGAIFRIWHNPFPLFNKIRTGCVTFTQLEDWRFSLSND